jgi:hypothetical protein
MLDEHFSQNRQKNAKNKANRRSLASPTREARPNSPKHGLPIMPDIV